jgi:3',5'-cyclic AMP phosphodiesterase CpdA
MPSQQSFGQQRLAGLADWATKVRLPGLEQETYASILRYVIRQQQSDGSWTIAGHPTWNVVMTSVILKSLCDLQFELGNSWKNEQDQPAGVLPAVEFLSNAVKSGGASAEKVGDDIWDACQAAIALADFGRHDVAMPMVRDINQNWKKLYDRSYDPNGKWSCPAYLAALVDVIGRYETHLGSDSRFDSAFNALKIREEPKADGTPAGFFASHAKHPETDIWGTSLVLRTLATVPEARDKLIDRDQIQRGVIWLIEQLDSNIWKRDVAEAPMYLARGLHGLRASRPWVDSPTRERIDQKLKSGNGELAYFFGSGTGNLKAYTAVLEYLASSKVQAPAGLVFDASATLRVSAVARREPVARDGGLRIVWLSDLHIGADDKTAPPSLLKRLVQGLMWFRGTPLTQHFQLRNVKTILDRVVTLKPDHILITGDLTNYAQASQFKQIHDLLLQTQTQLTGSTSLQELSSVLWTILPGNHDITNENTCDDAVRPNLGLFFKWFGTTSFPFSKTLQPKIGRLRVRLIGLDSNVSSPVWVVGLNARGRIDKAQLTDLAKLLSDGEKFDITLVSLHHHPIVVPELIAQAQDYFLSLDEADGRKLIQLCANTGVSAILHGHFHRYSNWLGLNNLRTLSIIGSAAGALVIPGVDEEFLELRECDHEAGSGVEPGLALYRHVREEGGWNESFTGTFLPSHPA